MYGRRLLRGDPVRRILDKRGSSDVDLIVVGSRGHGAVASAVLGSVSLGVLSRGKRPVLVVRAVEVREKAAA
jgi:nucleotide-binding universal stress UspA family protein